MRWLMGILMICLEGQLPIKYYVIMDLILLKIQNLKNINADLLQLFVNGLKKCFLVVLLKEELRQTSVLQTEICDNQLKILHKPIIRNFEKQKVYSSFKDNIWSADLADFQLMSKYNKGFWILLCSIFLVNIL